MTYQSTLNCSGTMVDILLEGVREMIGSSAAISKTEPTNNSKNQVNIIENKNQESISEPDLIELMNSAPIIFGDLGASGIALRIGEASFRHFLRKKGKEYSLCGNSYRLMNSHQRIFFGLSKLAEFANQNCGADVSISEDENCWSWCANIEKSNFMISQLFKSYTIGLLREFFSWTSGGRYFPIEDSFESDENKSIIQIRINKQPLGS